MGNVSWWSKRVQFSLGVVATLALVPWLGGLVTLGAIVAPIVFRTVPAPTSADAMTLVFRRFDAVAVVCGVLLLLVELARVVWGPRPERRDGLRALAVVLLSAAAVYQASMVSPQIALLHEAGALRGLGEAGRTLNAIHRVAEIMGKVQVMLGVVVLVLNAQTMKAVSLTSPSREGAPSERR
jgi:hypothetical protein